MTMVPIYQVDAFATALFAGNPAAVCPLEDWLDDALLQSIAAENNLAETAFFVPEGDGYALRWFTPVNEVDLCGHATLASAFVVFRFLRPDASTVVFSTRSGVLTVTRDGERLELDFPAIPAEPSDPPAALIEGLRTVPSSVYLGSNYMAVYESADQVASLDPDMAALAHLHPACVIATASGDGAPGDGSAGSPDFVSRFFAPSHGIPEDSVTGSAHCSLVPYWSARLGKTRLLAHQISARGGVLYCEDRGQRVGIAGEAVLYLEGTIQL